MLTFALSRMKNKQHIIKKKNKNKTMNCGIALPMSGIRDIEINIDGLPDYRSRANGESADVEKIEFFSNSGEES